MTNHNTKKPHPDQKVTTSINESIPATQQNPQEKSASNLPSHHYSFKLEDRLIPTLSITDIILSNDDDIKTIPLLGKEGFIFRNGTNLIAAYPKVGKTELMYQFAKDCSASGDRILFITEEPRFIWKARAMRAGGTPPKSIGITTAIGYKRDDIEELVQRTSASIIIIDTVRNLLGLENENDNSEVARILKPFITEARRNKKTLILLHHTRKEGGSHGRSITGGHAFLGIVDVALEITPQPGSETKRLISGLARVIPVPKLVYEMTPEGRLIALGDPKETELEQTKKRIIKALSDYQWHTATQIKHKLQPNPPSPEQIRLALQSLAENNTIERDPSLALGSKPGATYKWKLRGGG